jgi:hypothetical protein
MIRNNVVKGITDGIAADSSSLPITEDYNILNVLVVIRSPGINAGAHTITADPLFVSSSPSTANDLKLQSNSPAVNSGDDIGSPYNWALDPLGTGSPYPVVDQNSLGNGWERGAFGYR